jgi:hypothetical protein
MVSGNGGRWRQHAPAEPQRRQGQDSHAEGLVAREPDDLLQQAFLTVGHVREHELQQDEHRDEPVQTLGDETVARGGVVHLRVGPGPAGCDADSSVDSAC